MPETPDPAPRHDAPDREPGREQGRAPGRDASLGETLREARTAKGLELSDVAEVTHVRRSYLAALDEGRYADLPEDVYTRNFLRLYGKAVGLEPDRLIEMYARERSRALGAPVPGPAARGAVSGPAPAAPRRRGRRNDDPFAGMDVGASDAEGAAIPTAASAASGRRGSDVAWGPLLLTLLVVAAVVALGLWGFRALLDGDAGDGPDGATGPAPGVAAPADGGDPGGLPDAGPPANPASGSGLAAPTDPAAADPAAPAGLAAPQGGATPAPRQTVMLSVTSEPSGALVSVDGFALSNPTPTREAVSARPQRVVRVELEGYEPFERAYDFSYDRNLDVALTPVAPPPPPGGSAPAGAPAAGSAADGAATGGTADAAAAPAGATAVAGEGQIALTVVEPTWLEVYPSTARGQGQPLVYATIQPGASYVFDLPAYVHAGNAAGVRVSVSGRDAGLLGSPGAVVSRAFTQ